MSNNILLITQEYPADDLEKEFTPVVHFFAKEWVALGYTVVVLNLPTNFPIPFYWGAKLVRRRLESRLGINIRTYKLSKREYNMDGVRVLRYPLKKLKPHGRFSNLELNKSLEKSVAFCEKNGFQPDVIIGHWTNPTVDMMFRLKEYYKVPCALVMHDDGFDFRDIYKGEIDKIFSEIDCWGFRSFPIRRSFEKQFGVQQKSFMCLSGVPNKYIKSQTERVFNRINRFLFVGLLLKRKHPLELVIALDRSKIKDFTLDIVGQGDEANTIKQYINEHPELNKKVNLCGRIPRDEVSQKMQQADVFCMISKAETYGLVYIEAMAAGCITIASRNEGFDGIIEDGVNGFLCGAGDVEELTVLLDKINGMKPEELAVISENAIATARNMTDKKVAEAYIHDIEKLLGLNDNI